MSKNTKSASTSAAETLDMTCEFLIRRHGSNTGNQPMTDVSAVAIVTAADEESAMRIARANVECYANQHLEAVEFEDCDADEWNSVVDMSAYDSVCFDADDE